MAAAMIRAASKRCVFSKREEAARVAADEAAEAVEVLAEVLKEAEQVARVRLKRR
jgi:hypothetical protein